MTVNYVSLRERVRSLNVGAYAGAGLFVLCIVAAVVFGVLPHKGLLFVNAVLSGAVWMGCVLVLVLGGKRIDLWSACAAALIAAGLTTSIPSIFYNSSTVVDWGSTISRLGFLLMASRWAYDLYERVREEPEQP